MATPTLNQDAFRFRHDNGSEAVDGALWIAAANTAIARIANINTRLRFSISNTGDMAKNNLQCQLQCSHNSGSWFSVDDTSNVVRMSASIHLIDGADITQQLNGALTFDISNSGQDDGDGRTAANTLAIATRIEVEFCFEIRRADVSPLDTTDFRVTASGAALDNYNTPTARIIALAIPIIPGSMITSIRSGSMEIIVTPLGRGE